MLAPCSLRLPDGRALAFDDVGDPAGVPVVYLHGTPDSRLGRPPDDAVAERGGVRLLAVDRPGAGASDLHEGADLTSLGLDLGALLDHLGLRRCILLGWSSGGLFALGAATVLGDRVAGLGLVAPVPPVEAYRDADLVAALSPGRQAFAGAAGEMSPSALAAEVTPHLMPDPLTAGSALEHVLDAAGEAGRRELATVSAASDALAQGLLASLEQGPAGLVQDVSLQLEPGLDLSGLRVRVRTFHGSEDGVSPPIVGAWLVARLPNAVLDLSPGGSHHLLFPRWAGILRALRRDAAM